MNLDKQIRAYLVNVRKDITAQINAGNYIASGRMKANLRVVANQHLIGEIRGVFYMQFMEQSFKGKPKGIGRDFIEKIIDWMRFKGIQPFRNGKVLEATETNIKRSAFSIAKGIVKRGTERQQMNQGLDIEKAMEENADEYLKSIGKEFLKTFDKRLNIK